VKSLKRNRIANLQLQILDYLARLPQAQDTIEGIVEWWLLEQRIRVATAEVQSVLRNLIARRLVIEWRGPDGRTHYHGNPQKRKQIAALLEGKRRPPG